MSYVAIARKWRPRSFEDIAGQGHVTRTLSNAIRLRRIHHAYLFSGARGVGKTTAARTLARCLNCLTDGPRPDPCGECDCCKDVLAGNSPDVIEIDGASNNSVEDVRDLRESIRYLPVRGRYKVYIVDEVHMLSKGAFNALLKTLEEPPPHVVFIFATTEPQKIPETILSRVQRFDFKRIPHQTVVDYLAHICQAEGVKIPPEGLRLIARAGEGSMRDSQSLLDQVISFGGPEATAEQVAEVLGLVDRRLLYEMLEGMLRGEADRCLESVSQVYTYGYDLSEFTAEMLELLRNAALVGLSPGSRRYLDVPEDEVKRLDALARDIAPEVFVRSFQVMLEVHEQVARAPRPRLVLEMAVARLVSIRPARPVDEVLERLVDLERRLRHGGASAPPRDARGPRARDPRPAADDEPDPARAPRAADADPSRTLAAPPRASAAPALALARPAPVPDELPPPPELLLPRDAAPPALQELPPPPEDDGAADDDGTGDGTAEERTRVDGPAEDEGPARPPALVAGASAQARFHALRTWLEGGGLDKDLWAHDAVFLGEQPPELRIGFRSEFNVRQGRRKVGDRRLKQGLEVYFPRCSVVTVELAEEGGLSRREADQAAYERRVAELEQELAHHPLIARLQAALGARLLEVLPDAAVRAEPPAGAAQLPDVAVADPTLPPDDDEEGGP